MASIAALACILVPGGVRSRDGSLCENRRPDFSEYGISLDRTVLLKKKMLLDLKIVRGTFFFCFRTPLVNAPLDKLYHQFYTSQ